MLVRNWMSRNVVTIGPGDSLQVAVDLLRRHSVRMLPVVKDGQLKGLITDSDVKRVSASDANSLEIHELIYLLSQVKVAEFMTRKVVVVRPDHTVQEAAWMMLNNKISGMPVVDDNGQVVGIITESDVFRLLLSLTGDAKRGIEFAFLAKDEGGSIKQLTDIIRDFNGRLASVLTSYNKAPEGFRYIFIRAYSIPRQRVDELRSQLAAKAQLLYMIDHREGKRDIYKMY